MKYLWCSPMSGWGQFRKSALVIVRSALPPGSDIVGQISHVRSVPTADKYAGDLAHRGSIHKQASNCLDLSRALVLSPGLMEASERRHFAFLPRLS